MSVNGELETSSIATYTTAQTMSGVPGQFADAEDDSTPSSATPEVRQDGRGYIDDNGVTELGERDPVDEVAAAVAAESAQSARIDDEKDQESEGSSVEEERDSDDIDGGWPSDEEPAAGSNPELIEGSLSDEEALDWGVEDEDWELADGGRLIFSQVTLRANYLAQTSQSNTTARVRRTLLHLAPAAALRVLCLRVTPTFLVPLRPRLQRRAQLARRL